MELRDVGGFCGLQHRHCDLRTAHMTAPPFRVIRSGTWDAQSGEWTDFHDSASLDGDPYWTWVQVIALVLIWSATAVAVGWVIWK